MSAYISNFYSNWIQPSIHQFQECWANKASYILSAGAGVIASWLGQYLYEIYQQLDSYKERPLNFSTIGFFLILAPLTYIIFAHGILLYDHRLENEMRVNDYKEVFLKKIKDNKEGSRTALIISPKFDHNGAINNQHFFDQNLNFLLEKNYKVIPIWAGSFIELSKKIQKIREKQIQPDLVIVRAHGSSSTLLLGEQIAYPYSVINTEQLIKIFKFLFLGKHFSSNKKIIFENCDTGKMNGIVHKISKFFDFEMTASPNLITGLNLSQKPFSSDITVKYLNHRNNVPGISYLKGTVKEIF